MADDTQALIVQAQTYAQEGTDLLKQIGLDPAKSGNDPAKIIAATAAAAAAAAGAAAQVTAPIAAALAFCPACAAAVLAFGTAAAALIGAFVGFFSTFSFGPHYTAEQIAFQKQGQDLSDTVTRILLTVPEPARSKLSTSMWKAIRAYPPSGFDWPIMLPAASAGSTLQPPGVQGYTGNAYIGPASLAGMNDAMSALQQHIKDAVADPIATAASIGAELPPGEVDRIAAWKALLADRGMGKPPVSLSEALKRDLSPSEVVSWQLGGWPPAPTRATGLMIGGILGGLGLIGLGIYAATRPRSEQPQSLSATRAAGHGADR